MPCEHTALMQEVHVPVWSGLAPGAGVAGLQRGPVCVPRRRREAPREDMTLGRQSPQAPADPLLGVPEPLDGGEALG